MQTAYIDLGLAMLLAIGLPMLFGFVMCSAGLVRAWVDYRQAKRATISRRLNG